MKKFLFFLLAGVLTVSCVTGCRKKAAKERKERVIRVGVMKPVHKLFQHRIPVQGTVVPVRYATLSSKTSGSLDILEASEGKRMKKNALLFQVDKSNLENQVTVAQRQFDVCRSEVETAKIALDLYEEVKSETNGQCGKFTGTSNVYLAMKKNIPCLGTMSHQCISFEEIVSGVFECNYNVMNKWSEVYDGNVGIFLYDCFGDNVFFNNLSKRMAMTFCGLRIDSGVEEEQVDLIVEKYKQLGIDPMTKQAVFSNGLNIERATEIHNYCKGKITDSYGVGTFLTCDVTDCKPMNIVVKLIRGRITESREWHPCVKLSCDKGKTLGDKTKCDYLLSVLNEANC